MLWKAPPLTSDMLQALTLLCLYSTAIHKEGLMDDWLLSGISINHALISFNFLNTLPRDSINPDDLLAQLRLWNTLCATQLQYVVVLPTQVPCLTMNHSSALANGRTVNIQQQHMDQCPRILEHATATPEDGKIVAEIQLYRIALKLQHSQHRLQFAEAEYEEIERWKMEWAHLLSKSSLPLRLSPNHPNTTPKQTTKTQPSTSTSGSASSSYTEQQPASNQIATASPQKSAAQPA